MPHDYASYAQATASSTKQLLASGKYTPRKVTILSGQNLAEGAVLGKITASSKHILSLSAAVDGSQTPDMVLLHACDASGGDKEALALETGVVVGSALVLGTAHTIASIRDGLRDKGILIDD